MEPIIRTDNLSKEYKSTFALKDASISIEKGRIYGLVGENGAGKTTLIKLLAGLIKPTSGEMFFYGSNNRDQLRKYRKRFGFIVESPYLNPEMTAYENLNLQRIQRGIKDKNCILKALEIVGLQNDKKHVRNYSFGMKQRLGIAIALLENIDVLVLDEPTNGLDPAGIIEFRRLIMDLNRKHEITILISSHILSELEHIITDVIFVSKSRIVKCVGMEEVKKDCESKYIVKVSDTDKILHAFENAGISAQLSEPDRIFVFGETQPERIAQIIYENRCYTYELKEEKQSLEQYYLSLIGEQL